MTWREFAKEVPSVAAPVLLLDAEDGTAELATVAKQAEWIGYTGPNFWQRDVDSRGWTHWRYIDPPGAEPSKLATPEPDYAVADEDTSPFAVNADQDQLGGDEDA